jgi:hypothetical protein
MAGKGKSSVRVTLDLVDVVVPKPCRKVWVDISQDSSCPAGHARLIGSCYQKKRARWAQSKAMI